MKRYVRTDLACEREGSLARYEYAEQGCRVCEVKERAEGRSALYTTVHFVCLEDADAMERQRAARAVARVLKRTADRLAPHTDCVLVACLGNARVTPDSLGHHTAACLEVTRHVQLLDAAAFSRFGRGALCLVEPGVMGDTGVEAAELVRGVAREVGAGLVVVVDALAACRCDHLYATVQICDRGLQPGSGVRAGVRRVAIDAVSVGCPVISMGIPTVIDSATLICDALFRAGICGVGDALSRHLAQSCGYVVAPVQTDLLVARGGALLAEAIGECLGQGGGYNHARRHI